MLRFLMRTGTIFRVLVEEDAGCWIISYTEPAAPLFIVCEQLWQFQKVPAPEAYIEVQTLKKTPAEQKRQALIQSLLDNPACIRDRALRCTLAGESAARHRTTSRRVLEAYYRFLATGRTSVPKAKKPLTRNEVFDWAIPGWPTPSMPLRERQRGFHGLIICRVRYGTAGREAYKERASSPSGGSQCGVS